MHTATETNKKQPERHIIEASNAEKILGWFETRGGIAIWRSVNLSNPGRSWTCPVNGPDGNPATKPSWESDGKPERIITDPAEVDVVTYKEVKRFRVAVKRGGLMDMTFKLTDGSTKKLYAALDKAKEQHEGKAATYEFDYETQEAVILVEDGKMPLDKYGDQIAHPDNHPNSNRWD